MDCLWLKQFATSALIEALHVCGESGPHFECERMVKEFERAEELANKCVNDSKRKFKE